MFLHIGIPDLVSDFAESLAKRLNLWDLRFLNVIKKVRHTDPQKSMQNVFHQCRNLDGAFEIAGPVPSTPVLLIDDIIDSGLTMTVLAALLRQAGSGPVFPLALASTSKGKIAMPITVDAEATLLLTAYLSRQNGEAAKPLTAREWSRLVQWLTKKQLTPSALISDETGKHLECWTDREATKERIEALLQRKMALGMGLEKWERSGLWVMTRSDEDYPRRLKQKLAVDSPPVLFGCGNRKLLADGSLGVAVVGSRKTTSGNITYSRDVGRLAAENGWSVVSGGAAGVDAAAMLGSTRS